MSGQTAASGNPAPEHGPVPRRRRILAGAVEVAVLLLVGLFLYLALSGDHPEGSAVAAYLTDRAAEETGALNLVTAIYLGYRAFDTLGETIVLLLAVSGVMVFLEAQK